MPAFNVITMKAYVHSSAQHTHKKKIALFRLDNCDLNIIPITNAVLGSMCNNRPFYQLNGPSDKKTWNKELHCHLFSYSLPWRHARIRIRYVCVFYVRYARICAHSDRMRAQAMREHLNASCTHLSPLFAFLTRPLYGRIRCEHVHLRGTYACDSRYFDTRWNANG